MYINPCDRCLKYKQCILITVQFFFFCSLYLKRTLVNLRTVYVDVLRGIYILEMNENEEKFKFKFRLVT